MPRRRKWLLIPVALLVLLFLPGLRSEEGKGTPAGRFGLIADLIQFYRTYDRMTDQNWASFQKARWDEILKKLPAPKGGIVHRTMPGKVRRNLPPAIAGTVGRAGAERKPMPFNRIFFDPEEQARKGFGEDTYQCIVTMQGDAGGLKQAGARIISALPYKGGTIARVFVAGKDLEKVVALTSLRSITPVLRRDVDNDLGSATTGAPRMRVGSAGVWDPDRGFTGKNVIVGMIDTGIDWTHGDFIDPNTGETRIQYIWNRDVNTAGKTPADLFGGDLSGLTYGTVWTKAEIDGGSCTSYDTNGHGTHTSGTAAGNGYATGLYTGMAPNADIIMVQGLDNNGILFIYEMAKRMGKPCAVNMSYGLSAPLHYLTYYPYDFPMDTTDSEGQWIDALNQYYGGGHIPVKSAGNIGHWNTYTDLSHGYYPKKKGGSHWGSVMKARTAHYFNVPDYVALWYDWWGVPPGENDVPELMMGAWLERPGDVTIIDPMGNSYKFPFGEVAEYETPDGTVLQGTIYPFAFPNGAYVAEFWICPIYGYLGYSGASVVPKKGRWKLSVAPKVGGNGHADFWVADFNLYYGGEYVVDWWTTNIYTAFLNWSSHSNYIVDEGATPYEITVGAWTTRQKWNSIDGGTYTYVMKPILNTIAEFSSPGPARDRFRKPDIAAPGQIILSSLSNFGLYEAPYVTPDNAHQAMSGTSMAAPHVTGGVALMLQKHPNMNMDVVRYSLANWAEKDLMTRVIGPNGFGAGKFCLKKLKSVPVAAATVDDDKLDLSEHEVATFDGSASYDPEDLPITLKWSVISKPAGAACSLTPVEGKTAVLVPDPNVPGTYKVGLTAWGVFGKSVRKVITVEAVK